MKVHFITSRTTLQEDMAVIQKVAEVVRNSAHSIALDWFDEAHKRNAHNTNNLADWENIFKQNLETIAKSDVVIAEVSYDSFAVGYQVACAVQQKKPVLMLRHAEMEDDVFAAGITDSWAQREKYKDTDHLADIIETFLRDNDIQTKDMRFNFFIDRPIYNYLRWTSLKTGKTKAEILRELVEREIDRSNS